MLSCGLLCAERAMYELQKATQQRIVCRWKVVPCGRHQACHRHRHQGRADGTRRRCWDIVASPHPIRRSNRRCRRPPCCSACGAALPRTRTARSHTRSYLAQSRPDRVRAITKALKKLLSGMNTWLIGAISTIAVVVVDTSQRQLHARAGALEARCLPPFPLYIGF
jgi:hypothetical protein